MSLDQIVIHEPCEAAWDEMTRESGSCHRRYCAACDLSVIDLSGERRDEARRLAERVAVGERVCVRLMRDRWGRVVTRETSPDRSRWRRAGGATMELLLAGVVVMGTLGVSAVAAQHRVRLYEAWHDLTDAAVSCVQPGPPHVAVAGGMAMTPVPVPVPVPPTTQATPAIGQAEACDADEVSDGNQ